MKKLLLASVAAAVLLSAFAVQAGVEVEELLPVVILAGSRVSFSGFSQNYFENRAEQPEVQWARARLCIMAKELPKPAKLAWLTPVEVFIQTEPIAGGQLSQNWLKNIWLVYSIGGCKYEFGRVATTGCFTTPSLAELETVEPPRVPGSFHGWGFQISGNIFGIGLTADITGPTDKVFYKKESFEGLECSVRLSRFLLGVSTATTVQLAGEAKRLVADCEYDVTDFLFSKGAGYIASGENIGGTLTKACGFYLFLGFRPSLGWLGLKRGFALIGGTELHCQIDYRTLDPEPAGKQAAVLTSGIRLWSAGQNIAFTFDYVSAGNRFVGRLQSRF